MPEEEEEVDQALVQEIEITEQEACVKEALINTVIENEEQAVKERHQDEVVVKENPFVEENVVESNSNVEQNEVTNPGNTTAQFMCEQEVENYDKVSEQSSERQSINRVEWVQEQPA